MNPGCCAAGAGEAYVNDTGGLGTPAPCAAGFAAAGLQGGGLKQRGKSCALLPTAHLRPRLGHFLQVHPCRHSHSSPSAPGRGVRWGGIPDHLSSDRGSREVSLWSCTQAFCQCPVVAAGRGPAGSAATREKEGQDVPKPPRSCLIAEGASGKLLHPSPLSSVAGPRAAPWHGLGAADGAGNAASLPGPPEEQQPQANTRGWLPKWPASNVSQGSRCSEPWLQPSWCLARKDSRPLQQKAARLSGRNTPPVCNTCHRAQRRHITQPATATGWPPPSTSVHPPVTSLWPSLAAAWAAGNSQPPYPAGTSCPPQAGSAPPDAITSPPTDGPFPPPCSTQPCSRGAPEPKMFASGS